jgi:hypothetical protein
MGTMHWVTTEMLRVMQLSIEEKVHVEITNVDPAYKFKDKAKRIEDLWRRRAKLYEWGKVVHLEEFSRLRQVRTELHVPQVTLTPCRNFKPQQKSHPRPKSLDAAAASNLVAAPRDMDASGDMEQDRAVRLYPSLSYQPQRRSIAICRLTLCES